MAQEIKAGDYVTPRDDIVGADVKHIGKVGLVLDRKPFSADQVCVRYSEIDEIFCSKGILKVVPPPR